MNKLYKVYTHTTPDGMVYVGVTSQDLNRRWRPLQYKGMSLYPYIEKWGWDAIDHQVIYTTTDRDEAYQVEDEMYWYYTEKGCCINKQRSGLVKAKDKNAYSRQWREANPDYMHQWQQDHKEEINAYQRQYRLKKQIELFCLTKAKETPQLLMSYGVVIKGRYELSNIYSNISCINSNISSVESMTYFLLW